MTLALRNKQAVAAARPAGPAPDHKYLRFQVRIARHVSSVPNRRTVASKLSSRPENIIPLNGRCRSRKLQEKAKPLLYHPPMGRQRLLFVRAIVL